MIKEKQKKARFKEKTKSQIINSYLRTVCISFLIGSFITTLLIFHARSEMIKRLYENESERNKINQEIAKQLIQSSDFMKDLNSKNYAICLNVGSLYESIGDYENAQKAYQLALIKSGYGLYTPYSRLARVLILQGKFDEAQNLLNSVNDISDKGLIKFKTRAYIEMGDKYYSLGKFLSAAKCYEKANYYYNKFKIKDSAIQKSINERIVNAYVKTADVMVNSGNNTNAVRFLHKAEKYDSNNFNLKYKLAIIYSDLDPIKSVNYFESLLQEKPQNIDYAVYSKALAKTANIYELEGKLTEAKYYRYKIHSVDLFIDKKVVYKNDIEVLIDDFKIKKKLFSYRLKGKFRIKNISSMDIKNLTADFILEKDGKVQEIKTFKCIEKNKPLYSNGDITDVIKVDMGKMIFTKKELNQYTISIYLYKNEKYKTLVYKFNVLD